MNGYHSLIVSLISSSPARVSGSLHDDKRVRVFECDLNFLASLIKHVEDRGTKCDDLDIWLLGPDLNQRPFGVWTPGC
jgi:hypothetical protein